MKIVGIPGAILLAGIMLVTSSSHAIMVGDPNVYTNGNFGIGTSNPTAKMHVVSNATGYTEAIRLDGTADPQVGATRILLTNPVSALYFSCYGTKSTGILQSSPGIFGTGKRLVIGSGANTPVMFFSNNNYFDMNGNMCIAVNGNVGIGTATPTTKLDVAGEIKGTVVNITGGSDLSEQFDVKATDAKTKVEPGMVVCIDAKNPGKLVVSDKPYDRTVAGIVSGAGNVKPGMVMGQKGTIAQGDHPVALSGRVYCLVDATQSAIAPGDLLTTSNTPGHAMKVTDQAKAGGAILGKAMTSLEKGKKGLVLVLVTLQ